MLSEEEIIERLNNILKEWQKIISIEDKEEREIEMNMYFEEMPFFEIQGILDLYNKEKEKNKELEHQQQVEIEGRKILVNLNENLKEELNKEKEKNEYALLEKEQLLEDNVSKYKIINEMAEFIEKRLEICPYEAYEYEVNGCGIETCTNNYKECWIEYFTKKVDKGE